MHVLLNFFWQISGHLAWLLTNTRCICLPHGTPYFWPPFSRKTPFFLKRTPAVALIKAFILQLEQAFSEMQLEQAFQRPTLLYKCFYSPCYRQTPSQVPRHTGCQNGRDMNFSTNIIFSFLGGGGGEEFSKSTWNKQIIGCYG